MKKRHVFVSDNLNTAHSILGVACAQGIAIQDIYIEARSDIENQAVNEDRLNTNMDFMPSAWHGAAWGGLTGALAGGLAFFIPYFGISAMGILGLGLMGAMVGTWVGGLIGAAIPDEVRRTFGNEINNGKVLVVIDAEPERFAQVEPKIVSVGGVELAPAHKSAWLI